MRVFLLWAVWYLGRELNSHNHKGRGILSSISWCFMMLHGVRVSNIFFDIIMFLYYINPSYVVWCCEYFAYIVLTT